MGETVVMLVQLRGKRPTSMALGLELLANMQKGEVRVMGWVEKGITEEQLVCAVEIV